MKWTTKEIFKVLTIITLFLLFLGFLYKIIGVIAWLAAALLITILLKPLVDRIQNWLPKKSRGLSVFITFILVTLVIIGFALIIFPPLAKEFVAMISTLTDYAAQVKSSPQFSQAVSELNGVAPSDLNIAGTARDVATAIGHNIANLVSGVSSGFFTLITIVTLTFFMLMDTDKMIKGVGEYVPKKFRKLYETINLHMFTIVSKYFAGVLIVASIAGLASFVPLYIMHAPYALAMAATIAIFDLIPMIGATIGSIIVIAVLVLSGNIPAAVVMTIFLIVYQQVENNVIIPLVQKQTVKMSSLSILVALLVGGAVGGVIGTLLAIPGAALIKVIYDEIKKEGYLAGAEE